MGSAFLSNDMRVVFNITDEITRMKFRPGCSWLQGRAWGRKRSSGSSFLGENMSITVYAKPHCPQCNATKRQLDRMGADYSVVDLTQSPDDLSRFVSQGFQQAPIVVAGDDTWSGYRPDLLSKVSELINA